MTMMNSNEFNNKVQVMECDLQNIVYDVLAEYENKNQNIVSTAILGGLLNMYMKGCKITLRKFVLEKLINKNINTDDQYKIELRKFASECLFNECENVLNAK